MLNQHSNIGVLGLFWAHIWLRFIKWNAKALTHVVLNKQYHLSHCALCRYGKEIHPSACLWCYWKRIVKNKLLECRGFHIWKHSKLESEIPLVLTNLRNVGFFQKRLSPDMIDEYSHIICRVFSIFQLIHKWHIMK